MWFIYATHIFSVGYLKCESVDIGFLYALSAIPIVEQYIRTQPYMRHYANRKCRVLSENK